VALGLLDARDVFSRGLMSKEGGREAMDHYFHQVHTQPGNDDIQPGPTQPGTKEKPL
jgi:hypothetical protein